MEQPLDLLRWVFPALLLCAAALVAAAVLRRRVLLRHGGAVECHLRFPGAGGRRGSWRIGLCRYGSLDLGWFPAFSIRPRPTAELSRRGLVVVGRREPGPGDAPLTPDLTILEIGWYAEDGSDPEEPVYEVAMGERQLTGFLSWTESMPPGTQWEA